MILFNTNETVGVNKVIYSHPDAIKALAVAMMINMAEGDIDMVCDMSEEYPTKADIERVFQGLNEQALDMLDDVLDNLKQGLTKYLEEVKFRAQVRGLEFDQEGKLSDVTVDIAVE